MPRVKNSVLNAQAREMVYAVYNFMKNHYTEFGIKNLMMVYSKTAEATNTSITSVRRIVREGYEAEVSQSPVAFKTPGTKRPKKHPITGISSAEQRIIKMCIREYYRQHKEMITTPKLRKLLQQEIDFKGSNGSLRRIIKRMGFVWTRTENNTRILVEKSSKSNILEDLEKNLGDDDFDDDDEEDEDINENHKETLDLCNDDDDDDEEEDDDDSEGEELNGDHKMEIKIENEGFT